MARVGVLSNGGNSPILNGIMAKLIRGKVSDFTPDPHNANQGTVRGLRLLEDSLRQSGAGRSLLADKNGVLIAGNKTQQSAVDIGLENAVIVETDGTEVVIVKRTDLDINTPEGRAMAYRDNRVGELDLDWRPEQLIADMQAGLFPEGLFETAELEALIAAIKDDPPDDPGAQVDKAAELQVKWQAERGQVWQIGRHRLVCGDSTRCEDVERLMDGGQIALIVTDPPYGVAYGAKNAAGETTKRRAVAQMKRPEGLNEAEIINDADPDLLRRWFSTLAQLPLLNNYAAYIFGGDLTVSVIQTLCKELNISYHQTLVWVKDIAAPGFYFYKYQHELIAYCGNCTPVFGTRSSKERWHGESSASTVIHAPAIQSAASKDEHGQTKFAHNGLLSLHPTQKPVVLIKRLIENSSIQGEAICDPFLGSGTTMVAAEQTGRICYGMEIEPKYCAVTLDRLARMGLEPRLVEHSD